jgi:hypothetical protein
MTEVLRVDFGSSPRPVSVAGSRRKQSLWCANVKISPWRKPNSRLSRETLRRWGFNQIVCPRRRRLDQLPRDDMLLSHQAALRRNGKKNRSCQILVISGRNSVPPIHPRRDVHDNFEPAPCDPLLVTSVKVVEKRVSEEVAIGQAAMGGSFAGSASISGGVSSAIPSICM